MFDWNDEELANIIWDDDHKSDDHIVPYSVGGEEKPQISFEDYKKEWKHEASANKTQLQAPRVKNDIYSHFDTGGILTSEYGLGPWPDLSLSDATQINHDSKVQQDTNCDVFQDRVEDKDGTDFLDFGWSNIGSFDDLDRLVSHDGPVFGHASLGNADELWSSPKGGSENPEKLFLFPESSPIPKPASLEASSENFDIKTELMQQDDWSFTSVCGNLREDKSLGQLSLQELADAVECGRCEDNSMGIELMALDMTGETTAPGFIQAAENVADPCGFVKVTRQKKVPKFKKAPNDEEILPAFSGAWSHSTDEFQQFENPFTPTVQTCSPSIANQQTPLEKSKSFQYQHMPSSFLSPNQCTNIPGLSCIQFGENKHSAMLSIYEVAPGHPNTDKESQEAAAKSLTMTPREKIEKLRRQQQMQAILAIKKQQERFSYETSSSGHSVSQKAPSIKVEENINTNPFPESYSGVEQDDSGTSSLGLDDYSAAETIFHRLQDIVGKLDIKVRLCLRDSLYRLAQSAMQRQYASDRSSANGVGKYPGMLEVETETNPMDRAVANLLFHQPLDSLGKLSQAPGASVSMELSQSRQTFCAHQGSGAPHPSAKRFSHSLGREASEMPSVNEMKGGFQERKPDQTTTHYK